MGQCCSGETDKSQEAQGEVAGDQPVRRSDKESEAEGPTKELVRKTETLDHSTFIVDNPGKVRDFYDAESKTLGEGSFGSVCKATHKATGAPRAIKTISIHHIKDTEKFKQEISLMKQMDHPNIIKLFETFQDRKNINLVMELCLGGELFDRIVNAGHFTEVQAAIVMQQIFRAIYYMHENHICHRDIKPENFLFTSKDPIDDENNLLKVIDFGLSCHFEPGKYLKTKAGTPYYVSPQCLQGRYDQSCDLWSIGVVMYILLCGTPPFYDDDDPGVLRKVKEGKYSFSASEWDGVSADAKEMIGLLLKMDPKARMTAEQALSHKWVKQKAPNAKKEINLNIVDNLRGFQGQNMLKKAALHFIAGQLDTQQIKALHDAFNALDGNGNGQITVKEMREGIEKLGLEKEIPPDLQEIMKAVDSDGSGVIDYTEFLAASLDKRLYLQEDVCWQAFSLFDRDGSGNISKEELRLVLGNSDVGGVMSANQISELMKEIDANGDGMIDFQEFMVMMRNKST